MDIFRKKIIIISLESLVGTASGSEQPEDVTDFRICKDVLDRINAMKNISRIVITHSLDEKEFLPMLKGLEFFIFVYCKTAVSCMTSCDTLMDMLPHNLRRKDLMLAVGDMKVSELLGIDYITKDNFLTL